MEYLIGLALASAVIGLAAGAGFDHDRSFPPAILIVIASYYVLFAIIGGSTRAVAVESLVAGGFLLLAVLGFKGNPWLVLAAMVGHGVFDFFHHFLIHNPGVPGWWPGFCLAIDVLLGVWFAVLLARRSPPPLSGASVHHQGSGDARS